MLVVGTSIQAASFYYSAASLREKVDNRVCPFPRVREVHRVTAHLALPSSNSSVRTFQRMKLLDMPAHFLRTSSFPVNTSFFENKLLKTTMRRKQRLHSRGCLLGLGANYF